MTNENNVENTAETNTDLLAEEADAVETSAIEEMEDETLPPVGKKSFLKAAQGYGMIFGFAGGYILSGVLSEIGFQAGKFECVILCMFAGGIIASLLSSKKE